MASSGKTPDHARLDRVVAQARQASEERERSYRERALRLFPWVCGRCAREFTHATVQLLTVHHKDHNHDNNPPDGSNWELLCVYCHENEHARLLDNAGRTDPGATEAASEPSTYRPFARLDALLKSRK